MEEYKEGVYQLTDRHRIVSPQDITFLKDRASQLPDGRSRLRLHAHAQDLLQEMIIVLTPSSYVRPHAHTKTESQTILEGEADMIYFSPAGTIEDYFIVGGMETQYPHTYRTNPGEIHMQIARSPYVVIHETLEGPYDRRGTTNPSWSPRKWWDDKAEAFMDSIRQQIQEYQAHD